MVAGSADAGDAVERDADAVVCRPPRAVSASRRTEASGLSRALRRSGRASVRAREVGSGSRGSKLAISSGVGEWPLTSR